MIPREEMRPHWWLLWCLDGHFITRILCPHVNNGQLSCRQAACLAGKHTAAGWGKSGLPQLTPLQNEYKTSFPRMHLYPWMIFEIILKLDQVIHKMMKVFYKFNRALCKGLEWWYPEVPANLNYSMIHWLQLLSSLVLKYLQLLSHSCSHQITIHVQGQPRCLSCCGDLL